MGYIVHLLIHATAYPILIWAFVRHNPLSSVAYGLLLLAVPLHEWGGHTGNLVHVLLSVIAYSLLLMAHIRNHRLVAGAYVLLLIAAVLAYLL
jgi:hypothetical protein